MLAKGGAVKCTTSGEDPSALSDMLVTVAVARLCVSPRCTSALPCTTGTLPTFASIENGCDNPAVCPRQVHFRSLQLPLEWPGFTHAKHSCIWPAGIR